MIDWINLISGIVVGSAATSLVFWYKYGTKLEELSAKIKAFSKYGNNIPPKYCQHCHKDVQFTLVSQTPQNGHILNTYYCPDCKQVTQQYS